MALRAVKTDEEIAAIPLDQPILVELPGGVIASEQEDDDAGAKPQPAEAEDAAKALKEQLDALKAADKAKDDRIAKAERDAEEARRLAAERDRELKQARTQNVSAEEANIQATLQAAQDALAAAEAELERAGQDGDFKAMAKAQAKIGRTAADIRNLEIAAADVAQRKEEEARQPEPQRPQPQTDPIAAIEANPNLLPAEKEWLKAHPDAVLDLGRNKELEVAYTRAMKKDLVRGTPAYFAYLEEFMGYAKPETNDQSDERDISVQAPPSRDERTGNGQPIPTKFKYDQETRAFIKGLGITEKEYAQQQQRMEIERRNDPEKYR